MVCKETNQPSSGIWTEQCYSTEGVKMQQGGRQGLLRKKKMLWSPLLLSLIKFSALITIKPLSMYNNVCITEQHRCSPSTQLNIKMAVAVLIATWCASHFVCVRLCTQAKPLQMGLPWYWYCCLETCSTILSATSEPTVYMTYIRCGALCARKASLNEKKTQCGV